MIFERSTAGVELAERRGRLRAPRGEPGDDAVRHEELEALTGGGYGLFDIGESEGAGHLDAAYEVGDDVRWLKDLRRLDDAPDPFFAADVTVLARRIGCEEVGVPDLVVGVIDLRSGVLKPLHVGFGPGLRDDLGDPLAGKAALDGFDVLGVELDLGLARELAGDAAAGHGVGLGTVGSGGKNLQGCEDVFDVLHAGVGSACGDLLTIVVIDVAELALLFFAEVLADAKDGEVDEVAPFDDGSDLGCALSVGQRLMIVTGHGRESDTRQRLAIDGEPTLSFVKDDLVGGCGVEPDGDDGAAETESAVGEGDLFRGLPLERLVELGLADHVEGEDEVGLRLMLVAAADGLKGLAGEGDAAAEEVRLEDGLDGQGRVRFDVLEQHLLCAGV